MWVTTKNVPIYFIKDPLWDWNFKNSIAEISSENC